MNFPQLMDNFSVKAIENASTPPIKKVITRVFIYWGAVFTWRAAYK